jgi:hypothetical protein
VTPVLSSSPLFLQGFSNVNGNSNVRVYAVYADSTTNPPYWTYNLGALTTGANTSLSYRILYATQ